MSQEQPGAPQTVEAQIETALAVVPKDKTAIALGERGLAFENAAELEASEGRLAAAREEARQRLAAARQTTDGRRCDLQAACDCLTALRAQADAGAKARALHEQATAFDREAEQLEAESARLTSALEALDAYRRRLAQDLPIPGLSIEDKVIRVDGVPFEQLNTAQRVRIAVQVATLRAKGQRLPVVLVDGAEALDHDHFEALVAELKAAGVQAFVGRVADDPELKVEVA